MTKDSLSSPSDHSDQSSKNNAATPATTTEPINAQTNNSSKPANSASLSTAPNARNQNPSHTTLRDDPSPTPTPAPALPKPKPFADQFYEAVNEVLGGTNDQQFLMLTPPTHGTTSKVSNQRACSCKSSYSAKSSLTLAP